MRTNPDDRQFGYKLSQVIYKDKGHRKVAILRVNDTYGRKGATEFKDASRRLGYPIVLEVRYALQDTDYATQIERVRKSGADAVVLWSSPYHAARIVQQMQAMNLGLPVYGADRLVCNAFIEQAGPAAENVIAVGGLDPNQDTEMWEDFRAAFVERFGTQPDAFAAYTYDGTKMLIDSLERVGLNRAKVRDDLYSLTTYDGVSGRMRFDSTLANLGQAHAMQVREGRWVPYQPQQ
jgi:branched-chain amino acid transport system substrate-binding protein